MSLSYYKILGVAGAVQTQWASVNLIHLNKLQITNEKASSVGIDCYHLDALLTYLC